MGCHRYEASSGMTFFLVASCLVAAMFFGIKWDSRPCDLGFQSGCRAQGLEGLYL